MKFLFVLILTVAAAFGQSAEFPPEIPRPEAMQEEGDRHFNLYTNSHLSFSPDLPEPKLFDFGSGPEPYKQNQFGPYTHYVDKDASGAIDSGNPFGTPETPRLTWPHPLPPGSAVQVHKASTGYTFSNNGAQMAWGGFGTEEAPIFIYGVGTDSGGNLSTNLTDLPLIARSSAMTIWGQWTKIYNFHVGNSGSFGARPALWQNPVTNIVITGMKAIGTGVSGNQAFFSTGGSSTTTGANEDYYVRNAMIISNYITAYGDWESTVQQDSLGAMASEHSTNIWIGWNTIFNMQGDGARAGVDSSGTFSSMNGFIFENDIWQNKENAVDVKKAFRVIIARNRFHTFIPSDSSPSGTPLTMHYGSRDIWILNNLIYNVNRGLVSTGADNDYLVGIIGNVVTNISEYAMYPNSGGGKFLIFNNTIAHAPHGIRMTGNTGGQLMTNANNLIYDVSTEYFRISASGIAAASQANNLLMWQDGGGNTPINWGGTDYSTTTAWINGTTVGDGSFSMDPLLNPNHTLSSLSPARNAGIDWSVWDGAFKAQFGDSVTLLIDINGNPRGGDGTFDIGAMDYASEAVTRTTYSGATISGATIR